MNLVTLSVVHHRKNHLDVIMPELYNISTSLCMGNRSFCPPTEKIELLEFYNFITNVDEIKIIKYVYLNIGFTNYDHFFKHVVCLLLPLLFISWDGSDEIIGKAMHKRISHKSFYIVGASHGILPHVANIDNRSATVLICKCSLLCNNILIATHTRNSTAPSLLWYGLVNSAQQRTGSSTDPTGVLYKVHLKASRDMRGRARLGPVQTPTARKISKAQVPLWKKRKRIVSQVQIKWCNN
jgi:hypothetical protein